MQLSTKESLEMMGYLLGIIEASQLSCKIGTVYIDWFKSELKSFEEHRENSLQIIQDTEVSRLEKPFISIYIRQSATIKMYCIFITDQFLMEFPIEILDPHLEAHQIEEIDFEVAA